MQDLCAERRQVIQMIPDAANAVLAADGVARGKFLLELAKALTAAGRVESLPKVAWEAVYRSEWNTTSL